MKDDHIQAYLNKKVPFSALGEIYQGVPGCDTQASRNLDERWKAYQIRPADLRGKLVLDVGCNIGGFSAFCKDHCQGYVGIDVDPESIALAQRLFNYPNCAFKVLSFCDLQKGTCDVMLALAVRRYTGLGFGEFAKKAASHLSPGGTMYYESHTREKWGPKPKRAVSSLFSIERVLTIPGTSKKECKHTRFFVEMKKR